jgi:hypothetical protein
LTSSQHNQIKSNLVKFSELQSNIIKFKIESNITIKLNLKFHLNLVKFKVKLKTNLGGNQGGWLRAEADMGAGHRPGAGGQRWWSGSVHEPAPAEVQIPGGD